MRLAWELSGSSSRQPSLWFTPRERASGEHTAFRGCPGPGLLRLRQLDAQENSMQRLISRLVRLGRPSLQATANLSRARVRVRSAASWLAICAALAGTAPWAGAQTG